MHPVFTAAMAASLLVALPAAAQMRKDPAPGQSPAASNARQVTIVNRSREQIDRVRISPTTETGWGDDLLGDDVIAVNARRPVSYTGTCRADVQVVFHNGAMEARRRVDVCQISTLPIEPGWTLSPDFGNARR